MQNDAVAGDGRVTGVVLIFAVTALTLPKFRDENAFCPQLSNGVGTQLGSSEGSERVRSEPAALRPHRVGADPASSGTVDGTRTAVLDHGGPGM